MKKPSLLGLIQRSLLLVALLLAVSFTPLGQQFVAETAKTAEVVNRVAGKFVTENLIAETFPHPDNLSVQSWWVAKVKADAWLNQGKHYKNCLFGDSISSGLKNTLGKQTMNAAMGGLSSVSLVTQLKWFSAAGVQCQRAIIAIGTNDAWYITANQTFVSNLEECLTLVREMGASKIVLVPAFYSTLAASHDPKLAGPIQRVDEINALIRQVAATEQIDVMAKGLERLFRNNALKEELTFDGVHLNETGNQLYRQALLLLLDDESL